MPTVEELSTEVRTLRERLSKLSEAILRISESLDVDPVLREVVERARADRRRRLRMIPGAAELGDEVAQRIATIRAGQRRADRMRSASSVNLSAVG